MTNNIFQAIVVLPSQNTTQFSDVFDFTEKVNELITDADILETVNVPSDDVYAQDILTLLRSKRPNLTALILEGTLFYAAPLADGRGVWILTKQIDGLTEQAFSTSADHERLAIKLIDIASRRMMIQAVTAPEQPAKSAGLTLEESIKVRISETISHRVSNGYGRIESSELLSQLMLNSWGGQLAMNLIANQFADEATALSLVSDLKAYEQKVSEYVKR